MLGTRKGRTHDICSAPWCTEKRVSHFVTPQSSHIFRAIILPQALLENPRVSACLGRRSCGRPKTLLTPCLVLASLRLLRSACSLVSQEYSGSVCHMSSRFNLRNHVSLGPNPTAAQLFIHCHPHQEGWSKVWEDLSRIHRAKLYPGCHCSALAGSCTLVLGKGLLPQFVRDRSSVCHSHRG